MINYWTKKELNKERAKEHTSKMYEKYNNEIQTCILNTEVITEEDSVKLLADAIDRERVNTITTHFPKMGIEQAICEDSRKGKKAVLNFASYKNPGGMFMDGSIAQEESICHNSILYPILSSFDDTFYHYNRENKNKALYKHRILYTPDVIFENSKGKKYFADVITMAAPNRGAALRNNVSEEEIEETMRERIQIILQVAYSHLVDTLYLGAYGCGVFKNNPEVVSRMMYEEMRKYEMRYIFPIPDDETRDIFMDNFASIAFNEFIDA